MELTDLEPIPVRVIRDGLCRLYVSVDLDLIVRGEAHDPASAQAEVAERQASLASAILVHIDLVAVDG